jgi:hypothetical protein
VETKVTVDKVYGPGRLKFTHLLPEDPSLVELRTMEKLDEVVSENDTCLERALMLKSWTGRQWIFGNPDPYPPWNAVEVLDWIRSGKTSGFCGQYAMVYLQACLSLGIQARYIEIGQTTNPYSHFTTEVYLTEYGKWAVLDATARPHLASHYLVDEIPQNALELHRALLEDRAEKVEVVHDISVVEGEERTFGTALENYYHFRVFFRQDQGVNPPVFRNPADTADRFVDAVEWKDDDTVPWEAGKEETQFPREQLTERKTGNPEDLYWIPSL